MSEAPPWTAPSECPTVWSGWGVAKAIDRRKIGILSVRIDGELADRRPCSRASRVDRRGDQDRRGGYGLSLGLSPESETNSDKIDNNRSGIFVALSFLQSPSNHRSWTTFRAAFPKSTVPKIPTYSFRVYGLYAPYLTFRTARRKASSS